MERVFRATDESIAIAAQCIQNDEIVGFPTETQYGLAVNATSQRAIDRLCEAKGRANGHPIAVIVADCEMLATIVDTIPEQARHLIQKHWPGPLTLVLPAKERLPGALKNAKGEVGVRISSDPIANALATQAGVPITATSANLSGDPGATTALQACLPGVAICLDDGVRDGVPSTVISFNPQLTVLRRGAIDVSGVMQRDNATDGTR